MIELERHIEILLLDNDCVIVPSLGGFMTNHVEARYDDRDQMFLPPLRTLGFNPKLRLNDSLLAQSYVEAYDISYPEAVHRIEDEVGELRQHLENEGSYELNDIGTLFLNEEGNYEFTPCEAGILTPELYGLNGFEAERLSALTVVETEPMTPPHKTIAKETPIKALKTEKKPLSTEIADEKEDNHTARIISIKVSTLRNIAVAAIVVAAFLLFSMPLGNDSMQKASIDSGMLQRIMPKDITEGSTEIKKAIEERKICHGQPIKTEEQTEPDFFYTIVLASHVTKKNAAEYAIRLQQQGISAEVISRTSTKVISGRYATERDAYNALHGKRGNEAFNEAWVLKVKN